MEPNAYEPGLQTAVTKDLAAVLASQRRVRCTGYAYATMFI